MPADASSTLHRLESLLRDEYALLDEFVGLLRSEQKALIGGDLDDLLRLAERKNTMAAQLGSIDDQRGRMIDVSAAADAVEAMTAWLSKHANDRLGQDWQRLLVLAGTARELNALNGKLIAERMRHNQQALAILTAAGEAANLYGPDGQPRLGTAGRSLGSA